MMFQNSKEEKWISFADLILAEMTNVMLMCSLNGSAVFFSRITSADVDTRRLCWYFPTTSAFWSINAHDTDASLIISWPFLIHSFTLASCLFLNFEFDAGVEEHSKQLAALSSWGRWLLLPRICVCPLRHVLWHTTATATSQSFSLIEMNGTQLVVSLCRI